MAAGNKKKKKPAANPARGFATVSTQSKSKADLAQDKENASTEASGAASPATPLGSGEVNASQPPPESTLQDLSSEEFATQLEASELQLFIEQHAARVKKEASRQASRLRTDKRLLRASAEFLSVKAWLPEELMQQVMDTLLTDLDHERRASNKNALPPGDDLVNKIWVLRLALLNLDIPFARVNAAIESLLHHPPAEDIATQPWGFSAALDWLALECTPEELLDYDTRRQETIDRSEDGSDDVFPSDQSKKDASDLPQLREAPLPGLDIEPAESSTNDAAEISDVESDLEPDQLLSVYLRTRAKLFELNPDSGDHASRKRLNKSLAHSTVGSQAGGVKERKLIQKLKKIESDVLFDEREADALWGRQRIELAKEASQRKKLDLRRSPGTAEPTAFESANTQHGTSHRILDDADALARDMIQEVEHADADSLIGGMFDSLPGVSEAIGSDSNATEPVAVTMRNFGHVSGMSPRRVLEEACRSRDPRCRIACQQVSLTTYSCRHQVTINWSSDQDVPESAFMTSVVFKVAARQMTVTMTKEATPDVSQSESYVSTAALYIIFSGSPKEEKSHLRLPAAFRDLWDEFAHLKREHVDAGDREAVKELRGLVQQHVTPDPDSDDEVIFNAATRRLNGHASGISTPRSRPQTPKPMSNGADQLLKDIWTRKVTSSSYQRMLIARMNLPMFQAKDAVLDAITRNQITIAVGDTGSGKSTQLPHFILENELSNGRPCKIYCTQPRRISAISLAQRVSEELGENKHDLGTARSLVGYAIRLESHVTPQTKLVYATVGIVLRMLEGSEGLGEITHLVLDEVHERSIDTDFLLIVVRSLLVKRPDLKVVLMSATVDAQKFSQYLDGAPIVSVPGRAFPVRSLFLEDAIELTGYSGDGSPSEMNDDLDERDTEIQGTQGASQALDGYQQKTKDLLKTYDEYKIDYGLIMALLEMVAYSHHYVNFSRAILIFVPGIQEIRRLNDLLHGHPSFSQGWRIHALHSSFSGEDQQAAFDIPPNGIRKIVIATNIAETGITIPDITCVVDLGKHREMRFDERRQMSRLTQSFIARANAKQRRGRAGRVQEGLCFHLITRHRFENLMAEQQTPEMLRLSLQDLVMRVKICGLGSIETALSEALDPPSSKNIRRAIDALIDVGALTSSEQLTALGSQLAKLPVDAQLGKLILYGAFFGCLDFTLTVAASLSSKSPFLAPMYAKKQADTVRLAYKRGDSDLLTLYNAYESWRKVCNTPELSEYQFCNKNFLSAQNLANIEELKAQLLASLADTGIVSLDPSEKIALNKVKPGSRQRNFVTVPERYCVGSDNDQVASTAVAWSFYPKIIKQDGKGWRNVVNNQSLGLHPTSVNKINISPDVRNLSFYSIMQSSSKFTNAQETTAVSDFALALMAGDAVFHMYAGVIVIDGNRLKYKVRDWKTMLVLKNLRTKLKQALERQFKYPGRQLGERSKEWLLLIREIFDQRRLKGTQAS